MNGTLANSIKTQPLNTDRININDKSPLFVTQGMFYKEFPSDLRLLKYYTSVILQKVPVEIKSMNLLEKQVSELLKNAIKHGNQNDKTKKVKVHYAFNPEMAHLIIEDEGTGFQEIEQWNEFYNRRCQCYLDQNYAEMDNYISFKTQRSDAEDNGNFLFEAIKFWNGGIVFNNKKNGVAVLKKFPQKIHGINLK